ncbi:MAG: RpiB/LacA/LacB family sugar-phosphate isomerase [Treponema sp.]|jgi:ribose 5-phosphate isomerase RpiB|nr:RpiB/LacA/LacB family sugar-phosphate isomerase [Treponema sp.]
MMKIAVITEGSTKHRNQDVINALEGLGHEVYNLGMKNIEGEPDLTYMETGFMTALVLNLKAVDFVVGGCGTGQGYMNAVLQFPGTACGLLADTVDSYLFSQVNAGNCISLSLNKGYGNLGGNLNLTFIFQKLFNDAYGQGYPAARKEIQIKARTKLSRLSLDAHKPMKEILAVMDQEIIGRTLSFPGVLEFIKTAPASELKDCVLPLAK